MLGSCISNPTCCRLGTWKKPMDVNWVDGFLLEVKVDGRFFFDVKICCLFVNNL